jgi:predicted ATPase
VTQLAVTEVLWIGHGQCIEQYGAGEAYLPLLEALSRLGQSPEGARLVSLLRQYAPSWLLQLPALVADADLDALQRRASGATPKRMLRELVEAIEALTAEQPLVLVLEDLHWSDVSTLNWLVYMARRRAAARFLVLATYRPGDALVHAHPVHQAVQELRLHGQCTELALACLPATGVTAYLAQRFESLQPQETDLARFLHQHTSGNPLFLVTVVDDLVHRGLLRQEAGGWELVVNLAALESRVPASLQQLMEQQLAQLPSEVQRILEAASVAGVYFPAAAVAAAIDSEAEDVEQQCTALTRQRQFLQPQGMVAWPDGTVTACYAFLHALHHQVLYTRVSAGQRVRWHRQIGARLEMGYSGQARELAAELAEHFMRGQDLWRAVHYLQYAGEQARQRHAYQEAEMQLRRGIALLPTLPETPRRTEHELTLHFTLGLVLSLIQGQAAPEVGQTYARARALCQQLSNSPQLFHVLAGLRRFYSGRGDLRTAWEMAEQLAPLAQRSGDPEQVIEAYLSQGLVCFYLGDFRLCRDQLERALAFPLPEPHHAAAAFLRGAPRVGCHCYAALVLWVLGYAEQAVRQSQEAIRGAQYGARPDNVVFALHLAACLRQLCREVDATQSLEATAMQLATDYTLGRRIGQSTILYGWAIAMQGQRQAGLQQMQEGLATMRATGAEQQRPYYLSLLAEIYGDVAQPEAGLAQLEEALALVEQHDERWYIAELYRRKGELLLRLPSAPDTEAARCFRQALQIAHRQQAKSFELRAAMSLCRLWQRQGKNAEAYDLLAPIYGWFTEGFDTADLQEARALLAGLA